MYCLYHVAFPPYAAPFLYSINKMILKSITDFHNNNKFCFAKFNFKKNKYLHY